MSTTVSFPTRKSEFESYVFIGALRLGLPRWGRLEGGKKKEEFRFLNSSWERCGRDSNPRPPA